MRVLFCALVMSFVPVASAEPVTVSVSADEEFCIVDDGNVQPCHRDPLDDRGDPHVIVTIDPRTQHAFDQITDCVESMPCEDPEDSVIVTIEVWRDTNDCDGLQTTAAAGCGPADKQHHFNSTTLP